MPTVVLTLGQDGKPKGLSREDQAHYRRWRKRVKTLEPGQTLQFSWSVPRSPELHRRHFLMLKWIFENQETFRSAEELRKWTERGARHVEVLSGPGGALFERAKSIAYDELDDDQFRELHQRVKAYLLTAEALKKLWPHAPTENAYDALNHLMENGL